MNSRQLTNLSEKYRQYVSNNHNIKDEDLKRSFLQLLDIKDPFHRLDAWNNLKVCVPAIKELIYLANPFYLGYGNPNSDVLFLGKEKAFNIVHNPDLFIHESVNNTIQWEFILSHNTVPDQERLFKEFGFNPLFPKQYFKRNFGKRHTWGIYSEIVRHLKSLSGELLNVSEYGESFFSHCFLSEINHIPSRQSEGRKLDAIRKDFLKHSFYRSFPMVIIGAKGYLNGNDISEIFNTQKEEDLFLAEIKNRSITAKLYTSPSQKIILCNQLSGTAGWPNTAIKKIAQELLPIREGK